jgi:PAS domain S-box-containing protein
MEQIRPAVERDLRAQGFDGLPAPLLERLVDLVALREQALAEEREKLRRAWTHAETLRHINRRLNLAADERELLQALAEPGLLAGASRAYLAYIHSNQGEEPEWAEIVATLPLVSLPAERLHLPEFPFARQVMALPDQVHLVADVASEGRLDDRSRRLLLRDGIRALALLPLSRPGRWIGFISLAWNQPHRFTEQEVEIYQALLSRASSAVENRRLLARTQVALTEVQQSERLLRSIIDATPDWIFIKDRNHRFQLVNCSYAEAFGRTPEDFVGKDNLEMGWPEELVVGSPEKDIRGIWADDCEVMESGRIKLIPRDLVEVQGDLRVFDTIKIPLRDAAGEVWGLLGFARDMTDLKGAEDELRRYRDHLEDLVEQRTAQLQESQQLLEKTFASLRDAVFLVDAASKQIVDCNPAASEIFGYSRDQILGRTTGFLYPDDAAWEDYQQRLESAVRERGFLFLPEFLMARKTGEAFPTELSTMPLEGDRGRRFGWVTVVRDIATRKRMEEYVLRTERLAAMGRLAAALAHEINNPLHAIKNSLELVLEFPLKEARRQEYLQAVQIEIERLMDLTHRILDFARPPQLDQRPASVVGVVRHALILADKQLQESEIEVGADLPDGLPPVLASPDHLAQVFLNLIINAIEEMPGGGGLHIVARQVDDGLEVSFADEGPGIPPDDLPMIFEPFFTTKEDGSGLGLSVSYSIVEQYGGTISARNRAEGGAVFTVTLPVAHARHSPPQEGA